MLVVAAILTALNFSLPRDLEPLYPDIPPTGTGWLTGFTFRKAGWVNQTAGADGYWPCYTVVHYGSGSDSNHHVYLASKCQVDFDDIRFTSSGGTGLLDYWMDPDLTYNGDNVTVWFELVSSPATADIKFYIYYGNTTVSDLSDAAGVFTVYDGFDRSDSSTVGNGWTEDNGPVGGELNITSNTLITEQYSNYFAHIERTVNVANFEIVSKFQSNVNIGASWASGIVAWWIDGDWCRYSQFDSGKITADSRVDTVITNVQSTVKPLDTEYYYSMFLNSSHLTYSYGTTKAGITTQTTRARGGDWTGAFLFIVGKGQDSPTYGSGPDFDNNYTSAGNIGHAHFDWVYLRKITTSGDDPLVGTWGSREGTATTSPYRPASAGDSTEWAPSAGANYATVDDEVADEDSTYIQTGEDEDWKIDLYTPDSIVARSGLTVQNITLFVRAKYMTRSTCILYPYIKVNDTEFAGSQLSLTSSYKTFSKLWAINPNNSKAWDAAALDTLQIGVKGRSDHWFDVQWAIPRVTQVYLYVWYKPNPTVLPANASYASETCNFTVTWEPYDGEMDSFIVGHNNSGPWQNSSLTAFSGSSSSTLILTLNTTGACLVQYQFWARHNGSSWNTTGLQGLWVWKIAETSSEHILGLSQGSTRWGGTFYYNGTLTGGKSAIYVAYSNSTLPNWHYFTTAFEVNSEIWIDSYDVGLAGGHDAHWNPSLTKLPNGSLCLVYGYFDMPTSLKFRVGTENISTSTNLTKNIASWNPEVQIESNHFDYPMPVAWADRALIFGRTGAGSNFGNYSQREWNGTSWTNETELIYFTSGGVVKGTSYGFPTKSGNNVLYSFSRYNLTTTKDENLYMIYSDNRGLTWRHWNGTILTPPIWGEDCLVVESPDRVRAGAAFIDENNHVILPYFHRIESRGYGYPGLCQYSTSLGSVGTWSAANITDENGVQFEGWLNVLHMDSFYNRPSGWGSVNTYQNKLCKIVRVPGETHVFRVVLIDDDYINVHVGETGSLGKVQDYPTCYEALLQERPEEALSHWDEGAYVMDLNGSWAYATKLTANVTCSLSAVQAYMNVTNYNANVKFALYNSTGHKLSDTGSWTTDSVNEVIWFTPKNWPSTAQIVKDQEYWLAVQTGANFKWYYDTTGAEECMMKWENGYGNPFPSNLSDLTNQENFTRVGSIRAWPSYLVMRGTGVRPPSSLVVGWNELAAWPRDVTHNLGEVNASLNSEIINWTVIVLEYANGSQYLFVDNYTINAAVMVESVDDNLWLFIGTVDTWNHEYS